MSAVAGVLLPGWFALVWLAAIVALIAALNLVKHHYAQLPDETCDEWCDTLWCPHGKRDER